MIDVTTAKTADLVAYYNANSGRPAIKKFADRATAERRVTELLVEYVVDNTELDVIDEVVLTTDEREELIEDETGHATCPHCGIGLDNGYLKHGEDEDGQGKVIKLKTNMYVCMACDGEFGPAIKPARNTRALSDAIRESWTDLAIAAKRAERSGVKVDGAYYPSVASAFKALGLPLKEHIKFRMALKASGQLDAYGHRWVVVPLNY